jgi:hypothetical protein
LACDFLACVLHQLDAFGALFSQGADSMPGHVLCVVLGFCVVVILWAPGVHAQQIGVSLEPLPSTLSSGALANSGILLEYKLRVPATSLELRKLFFAGLRKHPRSQMESHVREVIFDYRKHKNQYLRCKLQSGRVVVGTVSYADADSFFLRTGLAARQRISYAALACEPQPVLAFERRLVRGLEITGMVAAVIVVIPILLPVYTVACARGSCPD